MRTRTPRHLVVAGALALAGCYAGLGRGGGGGAADGDGSGGSAGGGDGSGGPTDGAPIAARVRRLSALEYRTMVTALVGDDDFTLSLPPDPIVGGYDNDAASLRVNSVLAQALWAQSPAIAARIAGDRIAAAQCSDDERACAQTILGEVAAQAWRRPADDDELTELLEVYDLGRQDADLGAGLTLALRVVLQSPQMLYRTELGDDDAGTGITTMTGHEIAQAISFACTGGPPDAELLQRATDGSLLDADARRQQAERLLSSSKALSVLGDFATHWLEATDVRAIDRDPALYPEWSSVRASADAELRSFVATAILDEDAGFSELVLADWTVIDDAMAAFYGADAAGRIDRPDGRAAGVLALPGFLAAHAQFQDPSPVQRGHFVRTRLLCQEIPPPPNDAVVSPPPPDPTLSNRERWTQKTNTPSCQTCHALMDPLGFAFENFDASGQWRAVDAGQPVDAAGAISGSDVDGAFTDLEGMAALLAGSDSARRCFAGHWLQYAMAKSLSGEEATAVADLVDAFAGETASVRELIVGVVASDAFVTRGPMGQD